MRRDKQTSRSWGFVALVLLVASGCGSTTYGGESCPNSLHSGDTCDVPGDTCGRGADECGGGPILTCSEGDVWVETYDPMCCAGVEGGPQAYPDCPASAPAEGDACVV